MRGPALAEVDLDRVDLPFVPLVQHGHEVEREAADDSLLLQAPPYFHRFIHDAGTVVRARGELAAEVRLAARAAEHLIVGRQRLHLPERRDAQLRARASELATGDQLLD